MEYLKSPLISSAKELKLRSQDKDFTSLEIYARVDKKLGDKEWLAVIKIMENYNIVHITDLQILARLSEAYLHYNINLKDKRWLAKSWC